jgi:hypothetical protein
VRDDHRKCGLAEPGRTGQQNVVGGAILQGGGLKQELELPAYFGLADEFREGTRTQRALEGEFGIRFRQWLENRVERGVAF